MGGDVLTMGEALTSAITSILGGATSVFSWATSSTVLPYFILSVGCAAILTGVGIVKRLVWGA